VAVAKPAAAGSVGCHDVPSQERASADRKERMKGLGSAARKLRQATRPWLLRASVLARVAGATRAQCL
jgi:hypothetical protein